MSSRGMDRSDDMRRYATERALQARRVRKSMHADLAEGRVTLEEVFASSNEDVLADRVSRAVSFVPKMGHARTARAMKEAGVMEGRRIKGLQVAFRQRDELLEIVDRMTGGKATGR